MQEGSESTSYTEQILRYNRETINYERKLKRDSIFNKQRGILGVSGEFNIDIVTEEDVIAIANKIKHKQVDTKDLNKLKCAFIQNEKNINSFLQCPGSLHALVRDLTGSKNALIRSESTECIVNLSLGNDKCFKIAKAVVPYLINQSRGVVVDLQVASIWALGNLAASDLETWKLLKTQGVLQLLLELLPVEELKEIIFYALVRFVNTGFNNLELSEVASIISVVVDCKNYSHEDAIWLIYQLTSMGPCNCEVTERITNMCFDVLNLFDTRLVKSNTAVIRILANVIADGCTICVGYIVKCFSKNDRVFINLLSLLSDKRYQHLRLEFGWLIENMMNSSDSTVQKWVSLNSKNINEILLELQIMNINLNV